MDDPITPTAEPVQDTSAQPTDTPPAAPPTEPSGDTQKVNDPTVGQDPTPLAGNDAKTGLLGGETADGEQDPSKTEEGESKVLGAPEDGYKTEGMKGASAEMLEAFTGIAKELNLSQDTVDKLYGAMAPAMQRHYQDAIDKASKQWTQQSLNDAEFGGVNWQKNKPVMDKVYMRYASPELRKVFRQSGLDTHPEVLRMMYRISQDVSEDVLLKGTTRGSFSGDDARSMFPNTKMNP